MTFSRLQLFEWNGAVSATAGSESLYKNGARVELHTPNSHRCKLFSWPATQLTFPIFHTKYKTVSPVSVKSLVPETQIGLFPSSMLV